MWAWIHIISHFITSHNTWFSWLGYPEEVTHAVWLLSLPCTEFPPESQGTPNGEQGGSTGLEDFLSLAPLRTFKQIYYSNNTRVQSGTPRTSNGAQFYPFCHLRRTLLFMYMSWGVMKLGNIVPRAGLEPTSLVLRSRVLPLQHIGSLMSPLYPRLTVYAAQRSVQIFISASPVCM